MKIRIGFALQGSGLPWVLRALLLCGLLAGLLPACQRNDCLKSAGPVTTERRELPAFHSLTALDNATITLVPDTATYAEVRTGSNLQADLKLEVRDQHLYVSNESTCNWARSYAVPHAVTLHLPTLTNLHLYGQGDITTSGQLRADTMFLHLKGSGDFDLDLRSNYLWVDQFELGDYRLRGETDQLLLSGGSLGRFFAPDLRTNFCYLNLSPYADGAIHVNAANTLAGTHAGTSTVSYAGNPTTAEVKITGKGKVVRVN